jgi:hypothetical protein
MKKLYVLLAALAFGTAAYSQCTIDPNAFSGPNDYGIVPDTTQNLPTAYIGTGYNTDMQLHIPPDTTDQTFGTVPINYMRIDSVVGMPAGFTYIPNPSSGVFPGNSYACVAITGNPVAGMETGGPNNDGVYPLIVYITANVTIFSVPVDFPGTVEGYRIRVVDPTGINTHETLKFSVAQNSPNPADQRTEFRINAVSNGPVSLTVYNVLGSVVRQEKIVATKGQNRFVMETSSMTAGVYLCSFTMGSAVVTRRITISH